MFCPKCGAQISDGEQFCPVCGAQVTASGTQQSYTQPQQSYAPPAYSQPGSQQQAYSQPGYAYSQPQAPVYDCGIQPRDIAVAIILSVVTCGIYGIVWMVRQVDEVNRVANDQGAMSGVVTWLLSAVTGGIYGWYWFYQAGKKMRYAKQVRNIPCDDNTEVLYLILAIFGLAIVNMALIQSDLNKMATPAAQ